MPPPSIAQRAQRAARLLAQLLAERVAPLGIAPAQVSVLLELAREDGLTQRELLERLEVEQGTITRTLQRMLRDDLVARTGHEQDARATRLYLTKRARRILAPARAAAEAAQREVLAGLTPAEQATLADLLQRVIDSAHALRLSR